MKLAYKFLAAAVALSCAGTALAQKGETVKMVRIDPLTGLLGPVGPALWLCLQKKKSKSPLMRLR